MADERQDERIEFVEGGEEVARLTVADGDADAPAMTFEGDPDLGTLEPAESSFVVGDGKLEEAFTLIARQAAHDPEDVHLRTNRLRITTENGEVTLSAEDGDIVGRYEVTDEAE